MTTAKTGETWIEKKGAESYKKDWAHNLAGQRQRSKEYPELEAPVDIRLSDIEEIVRTYGLDSLYMTDVDPNSLPSLQKEFLRFLRGYAEAAREHSDTETLGYIGRLFMSGTESPNYGICTSHNDELSKQLAEMKRN
ncbi:MAG: hypothetical protein HY514_01720 [Candidatus Aenigmarchaeota archaeon]|nr:hypothetical protein [Candidatus Aenigmarchaeota archaeon]